MRTYIEAHTVTVWSLVILNREGFFVICTMSLKTGAVDGFKE